MFWHKQLTILRKLHFANKTILMVNQYKWHHFMNHSRSHSFASFLHFCVTILMHILSFWKAPVYQAIAQLSLPSWPRESVISLTQSMARITNCFSHCPII